MTALHDLSAAELGEAFRRRELSPVEVTDAVLAHIDRWEPTLCATWALDPDIAGTWSRSCSMPACARASGTSQFSWVSPPNETAAPVRATARTIQAQIVRQGCAAAVPPRHAALRCVEWITETGSSAWSAASAEKRGSVEK